MRTGKQVVLIATSSSPTQEAWDKAILGEEDNGERENPGLWTTHWTNGSSHAKAQTILLCELIHFFIALATLSWDFCYAQPQAS